MTDPITFNPYLGWVDVTDPANIPADVRIISAADLVRYENFGKDGAARLNTLTVFMDAAPGTYASTTDLTGHTGNTANPHAVTKAQVGLANVDNTADAAKPVSAAQQAALDAKAPLASPAFTGTVTGVSKAMVGLGNVDNTADTAKPVSGPQQTALDRLAKGVVASTGTIMTGLNFDGTAWSVGATLGSVQLTAGRWYRALFSTSQSDISEGSVAFALTLRKSVPADATSAGTDVDQGATAYTSATPGTGKTTQVFFTFKAAATETVNLKVCVTRATGSSTVNLAVRSLVLYDDGAQI